ncbi:hypothetical protein Ahy_A10g050309 [Arachis hypogaea]|uniref:Zinc finger PMZ-type domain-containing protein n=1 Tax=Arachis hypogaea TaxID=3818 RepID=A0A445B910_ARAHY|nr:hypothetical protein Ahy_A10g050309 [Arachis hypogaea]
MASNNPFIVVLVYPNCRMRNDDNGVTFECQDPILFSTQRVETLLDLKSLILSKLGGTQAREIEEGEEETDEDYVADSTDSESSDGGDEDEFVPETPAGTVARHVLPPPHPILALSAVPSHYHSLDLNAMHERTPVFDTCKSRKAQSQLVARNRFSQKLLAAIEKNREGIPKMRVTHCDRWASVFVVEELEPFEGWGHGSFWVRLSEGICDCGLFQSLHFPYRHALAGCATTSIEWVLYVHPVYRQEAVFKVYKMEFPPIPDESLWAEWHGTMLRPNPAMQRKATERPVSTRFQNDMDDIE